MQDGLIKPNATLEVLSQNHHMRISLVSYLLATFLLTSCGSEDDFTPVDTGDGDGADSINLTAVVLDTFGDNVDFNDLDNYANQPVPQYITKDNTAGNNIEDDKATLGRILFYDKKLSTTETISCSSCHQQSKAFSDSEIASIGVNGTTARHSMRLVNARFANEERFFWDKRAATLEAQVTQPIQDHAEMGYSGENGAPDFQDLVAVLGDTDYYPAIFQHIYGDTNITEARLQEALAQFIRSIQSFDSKYDVGAAQVNNLNGQFPNFTPQENQGKQLFQAPPGQGGGGCIGCHAAPEFDINPNTQGNNGVIGVVNQPGAMDFTNTRAPSLRDMFNAQGQEHTAFMHDGSLATALDVVLHYNDIDATGNPDLDVALLGGPGQNGQNLNFTVAEMDALVAFLKTLTGSNLYTDEKWSDPFL